MVGEPGQQRREVHLDIDAGLRPPAVPAGDEENARRDAPSERARVTRRVAGADWAASSPSLAVGRGAGRLAPSRGAPLSGPRWPAVARGGPRWPAVARGGPRPM
ncbi:hypothetical protein tb265_47300 [Gemmatimonadetes bacterium T265]|nr:hypothetical protein tb265_47300 [Gemmatimonadetes bacterium T265]